MNINFSLKIIKKQKKDIHQASKHLKMPGANLKLMNLTTPNLKQTKTFLLKWRIFHKT